jgi:hypothetical protein
VLTNWGTQAVQVLERIRVLGRMVATQTHLAGKSVVTADQVTTAAAQVEFNSDTYICGPPKETAA